MGILILESAAHSWAVSPQVVRVEEGRGSFQLTLTPPLNLPANATAVTIRAFRDGYSTTFSIPLEVRSLSLSLEGQTFEGTDGATLRGSTALQGFTAPSVTFTLEGEGAERFALSPSRAAPGPFSLRIVPTQEAVPGLYQLRLRAEVGGVVRKAAFSLRLNAPQMTASLMPQTLSVYQGREGSLTLRVRGAARGTYALALKDAITGGFISWASLSPASITLEGGEQEVGLTLRVAASAPLGTHSLALVLLGPGSAEVPLSVTVLQPTFHATLDRTSFAIAPGRSATATLTLSTEGGYSGTLGVYLVGNGADRFSLAPNQVNTGVRNWGLVLSAAADAPAGAYALEVVLTDGIITRRIPIAVSVVAP